MAAAVGSIVAGGFSGAEPGMLRLRPALSGGESETGKDTERLLACDKHLNIPSG